jgi:hypothetical protein
MTIDPARLSTQLRCDIDTDYLRTLSSPLCWVCSCRSEESDKPSATITTVSRDDYKNQATKLSVNKKPESRDAGILRSKEKRMK